MKQITKHLSVVIFILSIVLTTHLKGQHSQLYQWNHQLREMNYLVMQISALNIIQGLQLSKKQIKELYRFSVLIERMSPPPPSFTGSAEKNLVNIRSTFIGLYNKLLHKKSISKKLIKRVNFHRLLESKIIGASVILSKKNDYSANGCLRCHALPPQYAIIKYMNRKVSISPKERKIIDRAHITDLYGKKGMIVLWNLKEKIDALLFETQRYMFQDFQCCLLPPESLKKGANIGQAFVTDKWIKMFRDIRRMPQKYWATYRQLYIIPLQDIYKASQPGVSLKAQKRMIKKTEKLFEQIRSMDDIDFELQKKNLCRNLGTLLQSNILRPVKDPSIRQFKEAMFLLLPGNSKVYKMMLK